MFSFIYSRDKGGQSSEWKMQTSPSGITAENKQISCRKFTDMNKAVCLLLTFNQVHWRNQPVYYLYSLLQCSCYICICSSHCFV